MTVAIGLGGMAGWRVLQRTQAQQIARLGQAPEVARAKASLGDGSKLRSAEAITSDWQTMKVVLTAYGLEGDLKNRAFVKKVLESDLGDARSLANRLGDKRYAAMARALDLGPGGTPLPPGLLRERVERAFVEREFERQVGVADPTLRLALNARRELSRMALTSASETTRWFQVLGNPPLREAMQTALGLPPSSARAPIDSQLKMFRDAADRQFGSNMFERMKDPAQIDRLIDRFVARASVTAAAPQGRWSAAIALLAG